MPSVSEKNSEVILQNEQLGIEVRIRIDFVSGKFDVLETRSLDQEQASLNSFSKQLQNLNNQYAIEARNLLKALGQYLKGKTSNVKEHIFCNRDGGNPFRMCSRYTAIN